MKEEKELRRWGWGGPLRWWEQRRAEVNECVEGRDSELMGEWVWWEGGPGGGKL